MDILAHGLWAGLAVAGLHRREPPSRRVVGWTVALAMAPDLMQLLPLIADAVLSGGGWEILGAYATAMPGQEPPLSPPVATLTHHLHCIAHSALVAAAVTASVALVWRRFWWPLLGWWLHILIDVFTHSAEFFPSPVFYPLTYWGFDGIAWNTPWFMVLNYGVLALMAWGLWRVRARRP